MTTESAPANISISENSKPWKTYADLTKFGIVIFVLIAGLAGYAMSFQVEQSFNWKNLFYFLAGLFFLSSGSLCLNQVQEWKLDQKMKRTAKRPIAAGKIKPAAGYVLAFIFIVGGLGKLYELSVLAGHLGALTVILYNGVYTYWWKPKWIYAAVPGAIPGALPVTIGYAINDSQIFNEDSIYLFLILFLWQMPHFWALALRYKDDYSSGGIPTLPSQLGVMKTIYQMGIYTYLYIMLAVASPWFVSASWFYVLFTLPVGFKVLQSFFRYAKTKGEQGWLAFFMWTNVSVLVFMIVPVIDKWNFLFIKSN